MNKKCLSIVILFFGFYMSINAQWVTIYSDNFDNNNNLNLWSTVVTDPNWQNQIKTDVTPSGRRFLGQYGNQKVTLKIDDLSFHDSISISFDLFVIMTWDGNMTINGPDIFTIISEINDTLIHTTFDNMPEFGSSHRQAYPGRYPNSSNSPQTGSAEVNTLGYRYWSGPKDAVYHITLNFPHTKCDLVMDFVGTLKNDPPIIGDESWGIDNIRVSKYISDASRTRISSSKGYDLCEGDSTILTSYPQGSGYKYNWSTGNKSQSMVAKSSGLYSVIVENIDGCKDTAEIDINFHPYPNINIKGDTIACDGESIDLEVYPINTGDIIQWSNGVRNKTIKVTQSGLYSVILENSNGCKDTASINVNFIQLPEIDIYGNLMICHGDTAIVFIKDFDNRIEYSWSNGDKGKFAKISDNGTYYVTAMNNRGCKKTKKFDIAYFPEPKTVLPDNIYACDGELVILDPGDFIHYLWQDNSTKDIFNAVNEGLYWVEVTDSNGCSIRDSVVVKYYPKIEFHKHDTIMICKNSYTLLYPGIYEQYYWQNGSTDSIFIADKEGLYWVKVTDINGCTGIDSNVIKFYPEINFTWPDTIKFCKDNQAILYPGHFIWYQWSNGSSDSLIYIDQEGLYWVEVTDNNGCNGKDSIFVEYYSPINFTWEDTLKACSNSFIGITPGKFESYLWNDGTEDSILYVDSNGCYSVEVIDSNGCKSKDSIFVEFFPPIIFSWNDTAKICRGEEIFLYPGKFKEYYWFDGSVDSVLLVGREGIIWVEVIDTTGCYAIDSIVVEFYPDLSISWPDTIRACSDSSIILYPGPFYTYKWQDGTTDSIYQVNRNGMYQVEVTDINGCSAIDSVEVIFLDNDLTINNKFDLGTICKDSIINIPLLIKNNGLNSVELVNLTSTFLSNENLNDLVSPADSVILIYNLVLSDFGLFRDTVRIMTNPCNKFYEIIIEGNYIDSIKVWIESIAGKPGLDTCFKIFLNTSDEKYLNKIIDYEIDISYNKLMFLPNNEYDIEEDKQFKDRNVIRLKNSTVLNNNIMLIDSICGLTLLSDSLMTLNIERVLINGNQTCISKVNGVLSMNVCVRNLRQIVSYIPTSFIINPNPAGSHTYVHIQSSLKGRFELFLVDINSDKLKTASWTSTNESNNYNIIIDCKYVPQGMYFLVLKAPDQVITSPFLIVK